MDKMYNYTCKIKHILAFTIYKLGNRTTIMSSIFTQHCSHLLLLGKNHPTILTPELTVLGYLQRRLPDTFWYVAVILLQQI